MNKNKLIDDQIKCAAGYGQDGIINYDARHLTTELWGVTSNESINYSEHCVFRNTGTEMFGWKFNRTNPLPLDQCEGHVCPIYPNNNVGVSPWDSSSNSLYLPIKISNITSLTGSVDYHYTLLPGPSDKYDFIYDIWFTQNIPPDPNTRHELMIWLQNYNMPSGYTHIGSASDGINIYQVWKQDNPPIFSFLLCDGCSALSGNNTHKVNIYELIKYIINNEYWSPNLYLDNICIGNEVYNGKAENYITNWQVMLNGNRL